MTTDNGELATDNWQLTSHSLPPVDAFSLWREDFHQDPWKANKIAIGVVRVASHREVRVTENVSAGNLQPHFEIHHEHTPTAAAQVIPQAGGQVQTDGVVLLARAGHRVNRASEVLVAHVTASLASQVVFDCDELSLFGRLHGWNIGWPRGAWQACSNIWPTARLRLAWIQKRLCFRSIVASPGPK